MFVTYGVLIAIFVLSINLLGSFLKHKTQKGYNIFLKITSLVVGIVFLFRYMLHEDTIQNVFNLTNSPFGSKTETVFGILVVWFSYIASLSVSLHGFFKFKLTDNILKFIVLPLSIFVTSLLGINLVAVTGTTQYSIRAFLLVIETGVVLGYSLMILINETNWKNLFKKSKNKEKTDKKLTKNKINNQFFKKILNFISKNWCYVFIVIALFLSVMPPFTLQGLFGFKYQTHKLLDFEIDHRIILYIGIILPFIVHFSLRNKDFQTRKFVLLYICLGTLVSFSLTRRFEVFTDVTNWPLHLCNTAMYIMPIVLIFNMKKFFYFTYFINVAGAFLAMIMPNYSATADAYQTSIVIFYINHFIAFFMPILFVSLGMFEKPKLKQFIYSMIGFAAYFLLVLIINSIFTGMFEAGLATKTTDFFFVNSDFIADKLGKWAEDLREGFVITFVVNGIKLTFYWLYQILFFIVYVFIGLGMWFIFEQSYQIADSLNDIKKRKNVIKLDQLALLGKLKGRSIMEPVNPKLKNDLVLKKFSKRYGNSEVFAVKDADLQIHGGEIFGFLGPNGAGKSTIIKSVVGIQPITSGEIFVCGYDADKQPVEAKRNIGFVPDHYALYEKLTGREYINYIADLYEVSKEDRDRIIEDLVKRFELQGAFDNQMRTYSHGMKQKIAIMSALVHNPKIWILDEPLTGLDPNSILQVKECMKEHAKAGNIVFFSSHIIDVVERICDRIAIIKKGKILTCKSLKEIEESGKTLEQFYMEIIAEKDGKNKK